MKKLIVFFFFLFFLTFSRNASSQVYKTAVGNVEFLSKGSLNEFTGESSKLNGLIDLEKNILDFYIDLNTVKTGIGLRDKHMRENYLETKKYPFAEFTGKVNEVISLKPGESQDVTATGKFIVHGVEREISVSGKLKAVSVNEVKLDAQFKVKLSDYKIDIPRLVFYELADEQIITLSINLKK